MQRFVLSVRNSNYDGPVVPATLTQPPRGLTALQGCTSVVFLVHGFNVSATDGAAVLQHFGSLLGSLGNDAAAVAVLWPGNSRIGPLCYPFETNNADGSAVELSKFIQLYLSVGPRISFISHSLGARVVLQTIQQLRIMGIAVDQVCLMAAAVDDDCLASSQYRAAVQYANRVAVLYSPCDKVLRYAYPPGNLLSSFMHWTATTDAALGYTGPKAAPAPNGDIPSQVWPSAIPQADGVNHGDYLPPPAGQPSISQLRAASYSSRVVASAPSPAYGASD